MPRIWNRKASASNSTNTRANRRQTAKRRAVVMARQEPIMPAKASQPQAGTPAVRKGLISTLINQPRMPVLCASTLGSCSIWRM